MCRVMLITTHFFQINQFLPSRTTLRGDLGLGYKLREGAEGQVVLGLQVAQSLADNTGLAGALSAAHQFAGCE